MRYWLYFCVTTQEDIMEMNKEVNNEVKAPAEDIMFYLPISKNTNFYASKCEAYYYFRIKQVNKMNNIRVPIGNVSESKIGKVTVISGTVAVGSAIAMFVKSLF